jgi:hypothetical protein
MLIFLTCSVKEKLVDVGAKVPNGLRRVQSMTSRVKRDRQPEFHIAESLLLPVWRGGHFPN